MKMLILGVCLGAGTLYALIRFDLISTQKPREIYSSVYEFNDSPIESRGDTFEAEGTWFTSSDSMPQSTRLECYKEKAQCVEATATVTFGSLLTVAIEHWDLSRWDKNHIESKPKPSSICFDESLSIDLAAKTVLLTEIPREGSAEIELCKNGNRPVVSQLGNSPLRQKLIDSIPPELSKFKKAMYHQ